MPEAPNSQRSEALVRMFIRDRERFARMLSKGLLTQEQYDQAYQAPLSEGEPGNVD